jgi:uncharacterized protein (DUF885 family)
MIISRAARTGARWCCALTLATAAACTGKQSAARAPQSHADSVARAVDAAADAYVAAYFDYQPEAALLAGAPYGNQGKVVDNSPAALAAYRAREDSLLAAVRGIDTTGIGDKPQMVTYGILREALESSVALRVCKNELWRVDASPNSWQAEYSEVADQQASGSDSLRSLALARTRDLVRYLDAELPNLREGVTEGYTASKTAVRAVMAQLDGLLAAPPESSAFISPAARDTSKQFKQEMAAIIDRELNPAIRRYRDFLAKEYLAKARDRVGVAANPNGIDCYRASVRASTTIDVAPDSIHALGLAQVASIESEMSAIAEKDFGTSDVSGLLKQIRSDPKYAFTTRDEVRDSAQAAIDRAREALPKWFGTLPKAGVVIREYPEFRQIAGAPGEELPPGPDGSPAVFLINTYDPTHKSRAGEEALAFHEALPGHALQTAIAVELPGVHPIARYFFSSGFGEGWALYAEGLADEMGLYGSPLDRLGMLASADFRAARLVVDPALHTMGWTRAQALTYLEAHSTEDQHKLQGEVDRYISWPGQATSYMLGRLEILRLRQMAKDSLGARFDVKRFHDAVLGAGNITLPILRARVERWVVTSKR